MTEIEELNKYKIHFKHANGAPDIDSVYAESEYDAEDKFILSQEYEIVEVTKLEKVNGI